MKQEIAEQTFTTDSETPRNEQPAQPQGTLPEYMKDPHIIQSIISSNEELINQQALTIKHLQTKCEEREEIIKGLNQKYETLLNLASLQTCMPSFQNPKKSAGEGDLRNSRYRIEDMLNTVIFLEHNLSKTKVQLALKQDELLQQQLRSHQKREDSPQRRNTEIINRDNLEEFFEPQSVEGRSTNVNKQSAENKQTLEQWNKCILTFGNSDAKLEKIKQKMQPLMKKFIPKELRNQIWSQLVENRLGMTNGLYINLLQRRAKNWVCPKVRQQIDRDIKRSFYGKTQYETRTGLILEVCQFLQLFHLFRPDVSYVQGMTYPAIILIPILGKIKAFNVFCNIVLGNSFFRKIFSLEDNYVSTTCRAFQMLLAEYQPNLHKQLKIHDIQSQIFLIEWVFTIFSRGLSYETILNFWDHLLYYQEVALFRIGLCVFEQLAPQLLDLSYEQSISIIRNFGHHVDEEKLLASFSNIKLSREKMLRTLAKAAMTSVP